MTQFVTLREANIARHAEWVSGDYCNNHVTLSYRGNELAGEVGEVCNQIKKIERERMGRAGSRTTREAFLKELADAYICLDLICMDENISEDEMYRAIALKFNKTSRANGHKTLLSIPTNRI